MNGNRYRHRRRKFQDLPSQPRYDDVLDDPKEANNVDDQEPSDGGAVDDLQPFMGVKMRRKGSVHSDYKGDYLDVPSQARLMKILQKQGDRQILFADKVLKFTGSGKMKRRILIITDFAMYMIDPETAALKRRIALAAVEKIFLSKMCDNFFAIIIPTEYDMLMASTRKSEIGTVLVESTKSASNFELDVAFSNRFEYNAAADLIKEVEFEEVEGGVKTRISKKPVEA